MFSKDDLVRLLGPLIVEQILAVLVGMVDVMMVSAVGEAAVSGVALVDSISLLIIQILAALATGGAVVCAQYIGKQRPNMACDAAGQLLVITGGFSMLVAAIAFFGNRHLLGLIFGQVEPAVMQDASIYLWLTSLSYPFLAVYNACAALYRSMGNSKVSMMTSLVMNGINIAGNALCIYGLHMGVEGVAIPTLISRMFAACLMLILIQRPSNTIRVRNFKDLRPDGDMIRRILAVGVPSGVENGIFQFGKIALQSIVSTLGTASIASFAVASNLVTLQYLSGTALGLGLITIVGQCIGAGENEQAKQYTKKLMIVNYGILACVCTAMVVGVRPLVGLYNLSPEASALAVQLIVMHSVAMVLWPPSFLLPNALRAALDAKFTMMTAVFSMWVFRIGFAFWFIKVLNLGVMGVWYGMFIDWVFRGAVFALRFRKFSARVHTV